MKLQRLTPMLSVTDLPRTIRFYVERLGFECNSLFGNPPAWCMLSRDGVEIMFNAPPRDDLIRDVPPSSKNYQVFYFYPDDVAALHARWKATGLPVTDLRVTVYGMKEFELRDPDGYWLWFGQPSDEKPTVRE